MESALLRILYSGGPGMVLLGAGYLLMKQRMDQLEGSIKALLDFQHCCQRSRAASEQHIAEEIKGLSEDFAYYRGRANGHEAKGG